MGAGMGKNLTFRYDREGDTLYIDTCPPYAEQESADLGDEVIAQVNPNTAMWRTWKCFSFPHAL
jgi:hypothetical protein